MSSRCTRGRFPVVHRGHTIGSVSRVMVTAQAIPSHLGRTPAPESRTQARDVDREIDHRAPRTIGSGERRNDFDDAADFMASTVLGGEGERGACVHGNRPVDMPLHHRCPKTAGGEVDQPRPAEYHAPSCKARERFSDGTSIPNEKWCRTQLPALWSSTTTRSFANRSNDSCGRPVYMPERLRR